MSSDIEKLLKDAEAMDSSEYIDELKTNEKTEDNADNIESSGKEDAEKYLKKIKASKELANKKINIISNALGKFYKKSSAKIKKSRQNNKKYTKTEDQKHDRLFQYIFKNVSLLIVSAFILILVVAFFKVFVFSKEISKKQTRVDVNKSVDEISLEFGSQSTWREQASEDIAENRKNVSIIKTEIVNQTQLIDSKDVELKNYISKNMKSLQKALQIDISGIKNEASSMINKSIEAMNKQIVSITEDMKKIPTDARVLDGEFVPIPSTVATITSKSDKAGTKTTSETNAVILDKRSVEIKKEKIKKEEEIDRKIYLSTNVETIAIDESGYDQAGNIVDDTNITLPPVIIRQGFSNAVLITGVSAPTFDMDKNPTVVFISFRGQSVISNYFEQDVENCTATASVFGNILTRRAEMIVNKISCTFEKNNKKYMVRANVKGWVYDGNDGKLGVPGILVDSSGSILTDSALIGVLQGFGKFVSSSAQIYGRQGGNGFTIGSTQPVFDQTQVAKTNLAAGVGEQLASGFDTITTYYQKIIDTLYPYIDVKGGRKITILFDGGETLSPKEYTPFLVNSSDMGVEDNIPDNDGNTADDFNDMDIEVDNNDW